MEPKRDDLHVTNASEPVDEPSPEAIDESGAGSDKEPEGAEAGAVRPESPERMVLVMLQLGVGPNGSLVRPVVQEVISRLGGLTAKRAPGSQVDVWLDSPGGDAHAAYKLGLYLRSRFETVNFVILDYAKSAATLLALAGDTIYMAPAAELGPLDTQENREGEAQMRSNLDTANTIDNVYFQVMSNALSAGGEILRFTLLTREQAVQHALEFSAQFARPLLEQIDVVSVNAASTSLDVAIEYGARLLSYRHQREGMDAAKLQMGQLVRGYPTHGYVIDRDEARDGLGLPVQDIETYDMLSVLEGLYDGVQAQHANMIDIFDAKDLLNPGGGEKSDPVD